jgi:hypothetical protein
MHVFDPSADPRGAVSGQRLATDRATVAGGV